MAEEMRRLGDKPAALSALIETFAGRHFEASTMSTALLATPTLGMLISAFTLGEAVV
jgi:hypothetical protein